jgi:Acetyltransferases
MSLQLLKAGASDALTLNDISKRAFDSDGFVGGAPAGGPPGYRSVSFHTEMARQGHLYKLTEDGRIVGGAILFLQADALNVGRIFVAPEHFRKGYGAFMMREIESMFPGVKEFTLDTPDWNIRTNSFYTKLGYTEIKRDGGMVYYSKRNLTENMIRWAESKLGSTAYAGWCLAFIEDALEISNQIEIFGGDSAKESCEMYKDALRGGVPERGAFVFYDCLYPGENGPVNWGHCGVGLGDGRVIHAWDMVRIDDYLAIEKLTALTGDYPEYLGWVALQRVLNQKPSV